METELEKARHAKIREAQGKEPKIPRGEAKAIERDNLILGGLVENILGQINYTEMLVGEKMFLDFTAKLKDGRHLSMKLSDTVHQDMLVAQELVGKNLNSQQPEAEGDTDATNETTET